eukprot:TRINITY_DN67318_c9_g1_i1.p1 TRINITY_DN67318_c9_g1~~TRINITY_DN67318_c9_g1_i1.p1  ORF type:complete len:213 (+),score=16.20 TRINITY_DN67318_c9_g1_i1:111-749(+)
MQFLSWSHHAALMHQFSMTDNMDAKSSWFPGGAWRVWSFQERPSLGPCWNAKSSTETVNCIVWNSFVMPHTSFGTFKIWWAKGVTLDTLQEIVNNLTWVPYNATNSVIIHQPNVHKYMSVWSSQEVVFAAHRFTLLENIQLPTRLPCIAEVSNEWGRSTFVLLGVNADHIALPKTFENTWEPEPPTRHKQKRKKRRKQPHKAHEGKQTRHAR